MYTKHKQIQNKTIANKKKAKHQFNGFIFERFLPAEQRTMLRLVNCVLPRKTFFAYTAAIIVR